MEIFIIPGRFTGVIIFLNGYTFLGISHWGTFTAAVFALVILTGYISILFSKRNSFMLRQEFREASPDVGTYP